MDDSNAPLSALCRKEEKHQEISIGSLWWQEYHLHLIEYGLYSVPSIKDGTELKKFIL